MGEGEAWGLRPSAECIGRPHLGCCLPVAVAPCEQRVFNLSTTATPSYYLLFSGVKLYYSTVFGLKNDLAEQQVWQGLVCGSPAMAAGP